MKTNVINTLLHNLSYLRKMIQSSINFLNGNNENIESCYITILDCESGNPILSIFVGEKFPAYANDVLFYSGVAARQSKINSPCKKTNLLHQGNLKISNYGICGQYYRWGIAGQEEQDNQRILTMITVATEIIISDGNLDLNCYKTMIGDLKDDKMFQDMVCHLKQNKFFYHGNFSLAEKFVAIQSVFAM